ncbi:hypothetical protein [Caldimonas brevitalea]|uniref:Glycine zipper domain-containing protein n=1 Tax=Caldimonas brevitalea TaxID=413882 RepID=A0A0G3BPE6_9BURK|nr:hypothetical protein [Caldimonas brevitalea]AKJ29843.1 hypothetical protein AAW51_3152 [Caldimonas brevitalea]
MHSNQSTGDRHSKGSANRDPITGAPGAHPVGTGVGAAAGGMAAGAAVGTVAGPVGTAIGAAAGAIVGGLAGKGVAERIDPTIEDDYWRDNYADRPYVAKGSSYDDFGPAYRYGVDSYDEHAGRSWDEAEPHLARGWDDARGRSRLSWEQAKHATRDSWHRLSDRMERAMPGDADHDGH